jgi:hypothetical protein
VAGNARLMRAADIETFGGEVQMLELAAPQSLAPDEAVIAVRGGRSWQLGRDRPTRWLGCRPPAPAGARGRGGRRRRRRRRRGDKPRARRRGAHPSPCPCVTRAFAARGRHDLAERLVGGERGHRERGRSLPRNRIRLARDECGGGDQPPLRPGSVLVQGAGGVTGGLVVQLAIMRGATVVATAGPWSAARVRGYGATAVFDYHDPGWPARVREASQGRRGVGAAVNTARGGAVAAIEAVADGGRLATITGDPPRPERGVTVADVYVRADGARLAALVAALATSRTPPCRTRARQACTRSSVSVASWGHAGS